MSDTSFLIALGGGSGSGKSTLADALIDRLGAGKAVMFREDAYYWPMAHYGACESEEQRALIIAASNYDSPVSKDTGLMAQQLGQLKSGQVIEQPIYDYDLHDRSEKTLRIAPAPIIIVEGIHALSVPETTPLIDLSVYVDTPDDLRLARRIRRDVLERGRSVESVLGQYLGSVRPAHYRHTYPDMFEADLVIADEGLPAYGRVRASEEAIDRMLAPILERLRAARII